MVLPYSLPQQVTILLTGSLSVLSPTNGSPARTGQEGRGGSAGQRNVLTSSGSANQRVRELTSGQHGSRHQAAGAGDGGEGEGEGEGQEIIYLFTGNKKLLCQNNRLNVTQLSPEF